MTIESVDRECPECKGSGWLFINDTNKYGEKIVRRLICKRCDGSGGV